MYAQVAFLGEDTRRTHSTEYMAILVGSYEHSLMLPEAFESSTRRLERGGKTNLPEFIAKLQSLLYRNGSTFLVLHEVALHHFGGDVCISVSIFFEKSHDGDYVVRNNRDHEYYGNYFPSTLWMASMVDILNLEWRHIASLHTSID